MQACLKHAHQQIERSEAMSLPPEVDDFLKLQASSGQPQVIDLKSARLDDGLYRILNWNKPQCSDD